MSTATPELDLRFPIGKFDPAAYASRDENISTLANLPANLREPLVLRTIEGLSQADTASLLGISEKAVETRLYRARAKLEAAIE